MTIDCKAIAEKIKNEVREQVATLPRAPKIVCIIAGTDGGAESYLRMMTKTCDSVGYASEILRLPETATNEELIALIHQCNQDAGIDGILVQKPLPKQIDEDRVLSEINPGKDLDGFLEINAGRLFQGKKGTQPCTPQAVVRILQESGVDLTGKDVVMLGRSNIVGKPLSMMLLAKNATVTICHSKTANLIEHTRRADVVVVAIGIPRFLKKEMVTEDTIVIDVGTNNVDSKMVGDADYDNLKDYVKMITPVPGGVGPVTNAILLVNAMNNYRANRG